MLASDGGKRVRGGRSDVIPPSLSRKQGPPARSANSASLPIVHLHVLTLQTTLLVGCNGQRDQELPPFPVQRCPNCGQGAWFRTHYPRVEDAGEDRGATRERYALPEHTIIRCFTCSREILMLVEGEREWRKLAYRTSDGRVVTDW